MNVAAVARRPSGEHDDLLLLAVSTAVLSKVGRGHASLGYGYGDDDGKVNGGQSGNGNGHLNGNVNAPVQGSV